MSHHASAAPLGKVPLIDETTRAVFNGTNLNTKCETNEANAQVEGNNSAALPSVEETAEENAVSVSYKDRSLRSLKAECRRELERLERERAEVAAQKQLLDEKAAQMAKEREMLQREKNDLNKRAAQLAKEREDIQKEKEKLTLRKAVYGSDDSDTEGDYESDRSSEESIADEDFAQVNIGGRLFNISKQTMQVLPESKLYSKLVEGDEETVRDSIGNPKFPNLHPDLFAHLLTYLKSLSKAPPESRITRPPSIPRVKDELLPDFRDMLKYFSVPYEVLIKAKDVYTDYELHFAFRKFAYGQRIGKLMYAWCDRTQTPMDELEFKFRGKVIHPDNSPAELGLQYDDCIEVHKKNFKPSGGPIPAPTPTTHVNKPVPYTGAAAAPGGGGLSGSGAQASSSSGVCAGGAGNIHTKDSQMGTCGSKKKNKKKKKK
eukprot:GDKI01036825.1.p1 GENE.GDKI01036825.1~~GDKI01036825.1.p1  ORF type:complete len:432 (-),score=90.92 GDKI01036825.1:84-1379(-)